MLSPQISLQSLVMFDIEVPKRKRTNCAGTVTMGDLGPSLRVPF